MSFGAGHVQDMNNRINQNRAQRPSNRAKFKENNREGIYSSKNSEKPIFKTVSENELIKIKAEIQLKARTHQKKNRIISGIVITLLIVILTFIIIKFD